MGDRLVIADSVELDCSSSIASSHHERLLAVAREAGLRHFVSIHIPDAMVQKALAEGQDPCTILQNFVDHTILQWARRKSIKLKFIRVCEVSQKDDPNLRSLNPVHGLHAHILISEIPPEIYGEFLIYLANISNRLERIASDASNRRPRRPWTAGHVQQDGSGVPVHIKPAVHLPGAVRYMLEDIDQTTVYLNRMMRVMTDNKRQARPILIEKSIREFHKNRPISRQFDNENKIGTMIDTTEIF